MDETKYWLWLTMVFGTGSRRIWEAMCLFSDAKDAYIEISSGSGILKLNPKESNNVKNTDIQQAVKVIEQCEKQGIGIVGYSSAEYPSQLRHIMNPPAVLYYKGNISCLCGTKTITTVGTRKASDYSLKVTHEICSRLSANDFVIVSGFAVGIDITSHLAAVGNNRPTACVMGCGIDVDYPKDNFMYRDPILKSGGVFVSEYPPGTPPRAQNFPKRNRILSALGYAAIVFEASEKSGSLITANLAVEQGREVFCVPPADILSKRYIGNALLLRDGAELLCSCEDIFDYFGVGGVIDAEIHSESYAEISDFSTVSREIGSDSDNSKEHKKISDKKSKVTDTSVNEEESIIHKESDATDKKGNVSNSESLELLSEVQRKIYDVIGSGTVHADVIAQQLEIDAEILMTELTELEMLGMIKSMPGKMYEKI